MSPPKVRTIIEAHGEALAFEVVSSMGCPFSEGPCTNCPHFKARKVDRTCISLIIGGVMGDDPDDPETIISEQAWKAATKSP